MSGAKILGYGSYYPENIVDNNYLAKIVDTSDEWITKRTGIKERRISSGETVAQMAAKACQEAMQKAKCKPEEIDLIIVATITPDSVCPSTACIVQDMLGCKNATCFDISAACSGFIFSLITANALIKSGEYKKALVIGGEVLSRIMNWQDRNTCVLFGDGTGACVLGLSEENGVLATYTGSDGTLGIKSLTAGKVVPSSKICTTIEEVKVDHIWMDGRGVFKFSVKMLPQVVSKLLEKSGLCIDDIKYIVPHQANLRIVEEAARRLECPIDKFFTNLDKVGNTSGGSIPIALADMDNRNLLKKGDKIIIVGFGAGLTWGGALIEM